MTTTPTFPFRDPIALRSLLVNDPWRIWFRNLFTTVQQQPTRQATVAVDAQSGSQNTIPFQTASLGAGTYRASVFVHVTAPAATSSSLTVTVAFTHKGTACSLSGPALTDNLVTSVQSNLFVFRIDAGTPVTWSILYASVPAGAMQYSVAAVLEAVAG